MNRVPARSRAPIAIAALVLAALAAYANTFRVPFLFDDFTSIVDNPTIRQLWPPGPVLSPPHANGATVGGRPLLNLTFALNHAVSGTDVWSYHALNLLIHTLAGLTLFGLIRRTLLRTRLAPQALAVAGWSALLWTLHPVQTESVTYIVQRAESLNGLFYLLTLYAFVRGAESGRGWLAVSVVACLLGTVTKEVIATAPLLVLLHDRAFVAGTFRAALHQRRGYYLALASTWIVLALLAFSHDSRGGTAGFDVGVSPLAYALTQLRALAHYLRIAFVPYPLMVDHGGLLPFASVAGALPFVATTGAMIAATLYGLVRWPRAGIAGAWYLVILAPSSSVVPLFDSIFEHRLYLSLAAPLALGVIALAAVAGTRATLVLVSLATGLAVLTAARNATYRTEIALWSDNLVFTPRNARAWYELGNAHLRRQEFAAAAERFGEAVRLRHAYVEAQINLGSALLLAGRPAEALPQLESALRLHPTAPAHLAAARALTELGRIAEGIGQYTAAIALAPDDVVPLNNRANLLLQAGRAEDAVADYRAALARAPDYFEARVNAAVALLALGRAEEAQGHAEAAVRLQPGHPMPYWKLGDARLALGRADAAVESYREALRLNPALADAQHGLARALTQLGRDSEALAAYERLFTLAPNFAPARFNAALVLERMGRLDLAIQQLEQALRLQPDFPAAAARLAELRRRATKP